MRWRWDDPVAAPQVFTREEADALAQRVLGMVPGFEAQVSLDTGAAATISFARGDAHVATQGESVQLSLLLVSKVGQSGSVATNRLDPAGLDALVAEAKAVVAQHRSQWPAGLLGPQVYPAAPQLFFDTTVAAASTDTRAAILDAALEASEAAGLVSAGDLRVELASRAVWNTQGLRGYERSTFGEFSLTARTPDGTGSGWAWSGYEDWARVTVDEVIARAVELGRRSAHPVAIEPGRYTVILEPAAVAALIDHLPWGGPPADAGRTVFSREPKGNNKIGLQMMDARLGIIWDTHDPERPASPIRPEWIPIPGPITWFESGVLRNLAFGEAYAREHGRTAVTAPEAGYRLAGTGPTQTLEEMIASTKRGIWVNRLSGVLPMNFKTQLRTGTTRDGTFLIENGKITKPIKNFRFTESPFFVLNKLEAFGEPVRASRNIVCPRLKVRDFNFSSLTEAI